MLAGNRCNSILQPNLASTNVKSKAGHEREGGEKIKSTRATKFALTTSRATVSLPLPLLVRERR